MILFPLPRLRITPNARAQTMMTRQIHPTQQTNSGCHDMAREPNKVPVGCFETPLLRAPKVVERARCCRNYTWYSGMRRRACEFQPLVLAFDTWGISACSSPKVDRLGSHRFVGGRCICGSVIRSSCRLHGMREQTRLAAGVRNLHRVVVPCYQAEIWSGRKTRTQEPRNTSQSPSSSPLVRMAV